MSSKSNKSQIVEHKKIEVDYASAAVDRRADKRPCKKVNFNFNF